MAHYADHGFLNPVDHDDAGNVTAVPVGLAADRRFHGKLRALKLAFMVAALTLALAACGGTTVTAKPSASAPARSVHIAYATQTATALPIFIARDAGIFKSHGIEADIIYSRSGAAAIAALVGGDVQFIIVGDPNLTNAVLQGADIEYLAWPAHTAQLVLVGQRGLTSLSELKGKTVGVTGGGSTTDLFVEALLRKSGLEPKRDVSVVAVGGSSEALAAFTSKNIDAAAFATPFDGQAIAQGGQVLFDFRKSDYTYPQSGLAVKKSLAGSDPGLVSDVVKSYAAAVDRFKKDRQLAVESLMRNFGVSDSKLAETAYELANAAVDPDVTPRAADEQSLLNLLAASNPKAGRFAKAAMQSLRAASTGADR
jgi:NitT/TauT family transport system substrate-binding protein